MIRRPPSSPLFPYTPLSRSRGRITLAAMTRSIVRILDALDEPVILVAHSRGGIVASQVAERRPTRIHALDRKSTRLNSSHLVISYAVFCLKKKTNHYTLHPC